MSSKKNATLSMLTALAVVGRVGFTFFPNVQPMTAVIIITALLLGTPSGILVAVMAVVLSNLIMGMGLWTLSQILCWGVIGLFAGVLGKTKEHKWFLLIGAIFAVFSGYLYGFFMSIPTFILTNYGWAYYVAGLPFDSAHAIGNGVFFFILYPVLKKVFNRFMTK